MIKFLSRTLVDIGMKLGGFTLEKKYDPTGNAVVAYVKGRPVRMGENYDALAREGYGKNAIVRSVTSLLAKSLAHARVKLQRHREDGEWEDLGTDEDDEHELMMLLKKPNCCQSGLIFWKNFWHYYLLSGESFLTGNGPSKSKESIPTELWLMRPDRVEVVPGENNIPQEYIFNCNSNMVHFPVDSVDGTSAVFEMKMFNPINDWRGMSPLRSASLQVDQFNYAAEWNMTNLANGGRPQGALKYAPGQNESPFLTADQRTKIEDDLDKRLMGPRNARRPMVMDGGMEWVDFSMSAVEMDWLEGQRDAARTICLVYGVPPQLLGIPGDNTYSNYIEARLAFYEDTVLPLLQELLDALNSWLVPKYGEDLRLVIDKNNISALSSRQKERFEQVSASQIMTINEKRIALDMEPIDDPAADEIWMQSSLVPLSQAGAPPEESVDENEEDPLTGAGEQDGDGEEGEGDSPAQSSDKKPIPKEKIKPGEKPKPIPKEKKNGNHTLTRGLNDLEIMIKSLEEKI